MKFRLAFIRAGLATMLIFSTTIETLGADGPKPVADSSVGDGGVSAFYAWDNRVPGKPGQLLRQEALSSNLMLANASMGLRVLYSSTDGVDAKTPVTVSGTIFLPKGAVPAGGWPIVAWAHGTTGIADVCAPSWVPPTSRDSDYLNAWLGQGYAIVATDYQGLGTPGPHPYTVTRATGWSVLDSVRAALLAFPQLSNSVVIVGQSSGAQAALSAALLQSSYAPNIKLLGTVATGVPIFAPFSPPTKVPQVAVPQRAGGAAVALLSLYTFKLLDPAFNPSEYVSDAGKSLFDLERTTCMPDLMKVADRDRLTAETVLRKNTEEPTAKAAGHRRYPTPQFAQPVFIGSGLADVSALPEGQYNFVMAACYAGSTVEAHYYPGKDHGGTVNASLVDSIPFAKKLFSNQPISGNCSSVKPPPTKW